MQNSNRLHTKTLGSRTLFYDRRFHVYSGPYGVCFPQKYVVVGTAYSRGLRLVREAATAFALNNFRGFKACAAVEIPL